MAASANLIPPAYFQPFHHISVNDGLSQDLCIFIHQDAKGFLWFGTAGGLDRYDGKEFKHYRKIEGIPRQPVYFYTCLEENDSTLWIGTDAGMLRYNTATNRGTIFSHADVASHVSTMDFSFLTDVRPGVFLYYMREVGLVRLDGSTGMVSVVAPTESILGDEGKGIAGIDPMGGGKALVLSGSHLLEYDDQTRSVRESAALPPGTTGTCMWVDQRNQIVWIGTTQGLFTLSRNRLEYVQLPHQTGSPENGPEITALLGDSRGSLWLGMVDALARFEPAHNTILTFTHHPGNPQSIPSGVVRHLFEDRTQNLWISVQDKGVARFDLKSPKFKTIRNQTGFPKQLAGTLVSGLALTSGGTLWVAAEGLHFLDLHRKTIAEVRLSNTAIGKGDIQRTMRIVVAKDTLLCLRAQGQVYLFAPRRNDLRPLIVDGTQLSDVRQTYLRPSSGNLVMYLPDSVIEVNLERRQRVATLARFALPRAVVCTSIMEDRTGTLWFGTNQGLYAFNARRGFHRFTDFSPGDAIAPHQPVLSLSLSTDNVLWIGTDAGLRRLDLTTRTTRGFTVADGLPNDKVWIVQVDRSNTVWLGTNRGLVRVLEQPDGAISSRSYTIADGLSSNEFSMNAKAMDAAGTLYFGTGQGVVYWSPDSLADNPHAPPVVLTNAHLYGLPMALERDASFVDRVVIPYDKKVISFSYAALDFTDPGRISYAYFLEGYDGTWTEAGSRREAFYTNLDPGEYIFRVKATNSDGIWSDKSLSMNLVIVPPFWMTWWFRGFAGLALLVLIGGTVRYVELRKIRTRLMRLEQERALERERSRISRDIHDELGANLTSLSMMTEIARRSLDNPRQAEEQLRKAGTMATETVRKLDEIVWAVNPKADTLENLAAYISEFAQELFSKTPIRIRFDYPMTLPDVHLPSDIRHNIFLVVKESLHNIIKHSQATEATISLNTTGNVITLTIADNGIGCGENCGGLLGNGIRNMRQRMESIGGTIRFSSRAAPGTVLTIQLGRAIDG